jgi:acetyl-CoA synthetase
LKVQKNLKKKHILNLKRILDPNTFWLNESKELDWIKKPSIAFKWIDKNTKKFSWFEDGKINISYNCLDRHLEKNSNKIALIWQADDPKEKKTFTYKQLHDKVNRFSNVLKKRGIKKGDVVAIYLPMIPEAVIAMLACMRIGAVHTVVFAGFSIGSLKDRINYSKAKMLITSNLTIRAGKEIPLIENARKAIENENSIESIIVVKRKENNLKLNEKEYWWNEQIDSKDISNFCRPEELDSEDPSFILFTSGTTGKPKAILHTTAGYLLHVHLTFKYIFDYHENDIHWCTADIGWVTGHSYIIYGPLSNGATSLMYEGVPTYPDNYRLWQIIEEYKVNIFYTAPTVIRSLMRFGDDLPNSYDLSSLKILGSVGEPLNPEAWYWMFKNLGKSKLPIVDTWWQTEGGGFLISALPGAHKMRPGSVGKPFFGVVPKILNDDGIEITTPMQSGNLVIEKPWPGMMRSIYKNHSKFLEKYFFKFEDNYISGDEARYDENKDIYILGRIDDVVNVSGHRLGTAEIEASITNYNVVSEAAVVPYPHEIKGQALCAFVILKEGVQESDNVVKNIRNYVSKDIGPIAKPDRIIFVSGLPKTRSGKIIRRILKKIVQGETELGNTSTLINPEILDEIKQKI